MPYRLKKEESIAEGVRRIACEELTNAVERLHTAAPRTRDESVHEARKAVKKCRGLLRLVRPELGSTYRKENRALRDAGRGLSELRDAGAIIGTFDDLVSVYKNELRGGLGVIRQALVRHKRTREKELNVERVVTGSATALRKVLQRAQQWEINHDGYDAAGPGLKNSYRQGRRAMRLALQSDSGEAFHAWRRRAKDHWYHVRLLENLWPEEMKAREEDLHQLETALGEDHNLLVLCDQLAHDPEAFGGEEPVRAFTALASEHQAELRKKAIALGERLYQERARDFEARIEKLWSTWQHTAKL